MTYSVVDENNFQVIKMDILSQGLMKAGQMGEDLIESINNLSLISNFPLIHEDNFLEIEIKKLIPLPDIGISKLPWNMLINNDERALVIRVGNQKKLAGKTYPFKNEFWANEGDCRYR